MTAPSEEETNFPSSSQEFLGDHFVEKSPGETITSTEPGLKSSSSLHEHEQSSSHLKIVRYENDSDFDMESSTLCLPDVKPSTPKITITVTTVATPNEALGESQVGPSVLYEAEPALLSSQCKHEQAVSPYCERLRTENYPIPDSKSPVLHQQLLAASTPKVAGNIEKVTFSDVNVGEPSTSAKEIGEALFAESITDLEKSSQYFDPEMVEEILESSFQERLNLQVKGSGSAPLEPQSSYDTSGISGDLRHALSGHLKSCLPGVWRFRFHEKRLIVELMARNPLRSVVQRAVNLACDGSDVKVQVHLETLPETHEIFSNQLMKPPVPLSTETVKEFADVAKGAVYSVQFQNICVGVDLPECVENSHKHPDCTLDTNKFEESNYDRTLRTKACSYLVSKRTKRCTSCTNYIKSAKKRTKRRDPDSTVHPNTRNDVLSPGRLIHKLQDKQRTIRYQEAKLTRMRQRVNNMVGKESVPVDDELSAELQDTFENAPEFVRIFWEQQQKAHKVKSASGMSWHPLMIRWALNIKSTSSAAPCAMRDTGFLKLPSERTLYEYSHANPAAEGVQHDVLKRLSADVQRCESEFYTYYTLKMDEMYVFQNVVYDKGTEEIVGYANLQTVEEEIRQLENELDNKTQEDTRPVAKTMLTYMAKCVGSSSKGIVACYPTAVLTKEYLHSRTWDVIEQVELAGVKIIAVIGDGHATNHAFFNMHTPLTVLNSGVVFVTLNVFTVERPLFFFTDLPHLLKTIRNCFANSGAHKKTRMLVKNSEYITWQTIIACYKSEQPDGLRFLHKLTPQNVFLNSYSVMNVSLAARVLSKSVAFYIRDVLKLNRPETVKFLLLVNDWFDCRNGKYYGQDIREKNPNLAAYIEENNERFDFILSFVAYLDEWKAEVAALNILENEKPKRIISAQTLNGIERTTNAFVALTKYLLGKKRINTDGSKEGYILGRAYQQDEEEQYFSRQRAMGGGNTNPSISQFLQHQTTIEVQGNLGMRRSRGNPEEMREKIDVNLPVPKRRKVNRQLDLSDSD